MGFRAHAWAQIPSYLPEMQEKLLESGVTGEAPDIQECVLGTGGQ